jgi:hypothetical protein
MNVRITTVALVAALAAFRPAHAQPGPTPPAEPGPSQEPAAAAEAPEASQESAATAEEPASKGELAALLEELRRLKLEIGLRDVEYQSFAGMGPAASKVYFAPKGLSLGGYGEFYYRNNLGETGSDACATTPGACDVTDILRAVLYTGYRFSDKIVFNSEVEFEHQSQVFVEFAYLDFLFTDALRLRLGNVLVPMGIVNELHEPVFFHGVQRPEVERSIIPSTWNENGIGLHGEMAPGLTYKLYGLQGLNAAKTPGASTWIRGMRTRGGTFGDAAGQRALAETFAGVLALAYETGPVLVGGSVYHGRAGQDQLVRPTAIGGTSPLPQDLREIDGEVTMYEAHAQVAMRGAHLRALAVQGHLGDAALINERHQLTGNRGVGSRVRGAYVEGAYDVFTLLGREDALVPFVRYELLKFHDQVPTGTTRNPSLDVDLVTTGLTYKPHPSVAVKADYSWRKTQAANDAVARSINVGAGFVF